MRPGRWQAGAGPFAGRADVQAMILRGVGGVALAWQTAVGSRGDRRDVHPVHGSNRGSCFGRCKSTARATDARQSALRPAGPRATRQGLDLGGGAPARICGFSQGSPINLIVCRWISPFRQLPHDTSVH